MSTAISKLALYTTIYPAAEEFLAEWYHSVTAQTDQNFELWFGLDSIRPAAVEQTIGAALDANWVVAPPGTTPASIRQLALAQIVSACDGVVLVDSDDVLHPSRVAAAREALRASDLAGCALRLVDQRSHDLGLTFGLPSHLELERILPGNNVFGFSNSAFRTDLLKRCLPISAKAVLVDWFLATRAWLLGAKLSFDPIPRMDYRQHTANTARVRFPFSREQVLSDTALVRQHFQLLLSELSDNILPERVIIFRKLVADVEEFHKHVVLDPMKLDSYVNALNALEPPPLWWTCVAFQALGHMWKMRLNQI